MSDDYERGQNAAMDADFYKLDSELVNEIIASEKDNEDFVAGWNAYFQWSQAPARDVGQVAE